MLLAVHLGLRKFRVCTVAIVTPPALWIVCSACADIVQKTASELPLPPGGPLGFPSSELMEGRVVSPASRAAGRLCTPHWVDKDVVLVSALQMKTSTLLLCADWGGGSI